MFIDDHEGTDDALRTNQTLIDTQERLGALLDLMPTGLVIHQMQGILYANQQALHLFDQDSEAFIGQHLLDFVPDDVREECMGLFMSTFNSDTVVKLPEIKIEAKDRTFTYLKATAGRLPWEGTSVIQILLEDITELKLQAEELRKLTFHDPLTGAYNRRYYIELAKLIVDNSIEEGSPFSLMIFDLDNFKQINDNRGHMAGDEALKAIVQVWNENTRHNEDEDREPDGTLARIGGEEFAIILKNTDLDKAAIVAERIRKAFEERTITYDDQTFNVTASFGLTTLKEGDKDLDDLIRRADSALYKAKENGRNQIYIEK